MMSPLPASGQGGNLSLPCSSPRGGYRYRSKPVGTGGTPEAAKPSIETALLEHRQKLSQAVATVRAITTRRNHQIAEALSDGVPSVILAAVTATTPTAIRTIGLSFEDMLPQGAPPDAHITMLSSTARELKAAEADKMRLKRQREHLIGTAHTLETYDEYQIAALTGVPAPEIRRMIRGHTNKHQKALGSGH